MGVAIPRIKVENRRGFTKKNGAEELDLPDIDADEDLDSFSWAGVKVRLALRRNFVPV